MIGLVETCSVWKNNNNIYSVIYLSLYKQRDGQRQIKQQGGVGHT
jgi:hypothetical protein